MDTCIILYSPLCKCVFFGYLVCLYVLFLLPFLYSFSPFPTFIECYKHFFFVLNKRNIFAFKKCFLRIKFQG